MSISQAYIEKVIAALKQVDHISYRRLFNGVGIYHRGVQFAFVVNDHLYFRADEYSRPLYQQKSMQAFQPLVASQVESSFYQLPDDVLQSPNELKHWMRIAVEAAHQGDFLDDETHIEAPVRHFKATVNH
jgi:DNA transformation protein and related proteins